VAKILEIGLILGLIPIFPFLCYPVLIGTRFEEVRRTIVIDESKIFILYVEIPRGGTYVFS
jgi:hypothetical protein